MSGTSWWLALQLLESSTRCLFKRPSKWLHQMTLSWCARRHFWMLLGHWIGTRSDFQAHWSLGHGQLICQERDRRLHTKKMKTLFEAADESGDGVIAPWQEKNTWAHPVSELQTPPVHIIRSVWLQNIANVCKCMQMYCDEHVGPHAQTQDRTYVACVHHTIVQIQQSCQICESHAKEARYLQQKCKFKKLSGFRGVPNPSCFSHLLSFRLTDWPVCWYIVPCRICCAHVRDHLISLGSFMWIQHKYIIGRDEKESVLRAHGEQWEHEACERDSNKIQNILKCYGPWLAYITVAYLAYFVQRISAQ